MTRNSSLKAHSLTLTARPGSRPGLSMRLWSVHLSASPPTNSPSSPSRTEDRTALKKQRTDHSVPIAIQIEPSKSRPGSRGSISFARMSHAISCFALCALRSALCLRRILESGSGSVSPVDRMDANLILIPGISTSTSPPCVLFCRVASAPSGLSSPLFLDA